MMEAERPMAKSCFRDVDDFERLGCADATAHARCKGTGNKGTDSNRMGA